MNKTPPISKQDSLHKLRNGRVHEVCGPAAHSFAMTICGEHSGTIIWIDEVRQIERVLPAGFIRFCNPGRIIFVRGYNHLDVLWMAEECLRSKAAPVIVTRLSQSLDFTQGRRLQLAAETGKSLGLFLVPEGMGSNAAETRWLCTPCFDSNDSTLQHWKLIKNKTGTIKDWIVNWNEQAHRITVVSKTGERPDFARAVN
jgi:protein ImuA